MDESSTIDPVRADLEGLFTRLDELCTRPDAELHRRPPYAGAWSLTEHLEHVALVNHFLLLTISKGVAIALRRARNRPPPVGTNDLALLAPIADPNAFPWEPPGHMVPTGKEPIDEVRSRLSAQHRHCLELLGRMAGGEGRLCSFRMSVYSLGRLDMYQWLSFLAHHGRWHLTFLGRRGMGKTNNG